MNTRLPPHQFTTHSLGFAPSAPRTSVWPAVLKIDTAIYRLRKGECAENAPSRASDKCSIQSGQS